MYMTFELRVYMIFNIHQEGAPEVAHIHPGEAAVCLLILASEIC